MQVKAIYDHGKVELLEDIQLKHERFNVVVELPDEEIIGEHQELKEKGGIRNRINNILGKYASEFQDNVLVDGKAEWRAHLERKYLK